MKYQVGDSEGRAALHGKGIGFASPALIAASAPCPLLAKIGIQIRQQKVYNHIVLAEAAH
jgi:hypothetical protein